MGMDINGRNPKNTRGEYFRANVWSWRPMHMLIETANSLDNLDIDTSNYGNNSGAGLETQEECDKLADSIEKIINEDKNFNDESDTIYVNLGMWVNDNGGFSVPNHIEKELNEQYPVGTLLYTSIVASNGELVNPAWGTSRSHVTDFIYFLRSCGGFEIW